MRRLLVRHAARIVGTTLELNGSIPGFLFALAVAAKVLAELHDLIDQIDNPDIQGFALTVFVIVATFGTIPALGGLMLLGRFVTGLGEQLSAPVDVGATTQPIDGEATVKLSR